MSGTFPYGRPAVRKTARACESCRRRKHKCNGANPCSRCVDSGIECIYISANDPEAGNKSARITRACDFCRRRKLKCSGGTLCSNCRDHGHTCAYTTSLGQPASRPANSREYDQQLIAYRSRQELATPCLWQAPAASFNISEAAMEKLMSPLNAINCYAATDTSFYGLSSNVSFIQNVYNFLSQSRSNAGLPSIENGEDNTSSSSSALPDELAYIKNHTIFFTPLGPLQDLPYKASKEAMLHLVNQFFDHLHTFLPLFIPNDLISIASELWDTGAEALETCPNVDRYMLATVYMVIACGAACLTSDEPFHGVTPYIWSVAYFQRARKLMTDMNFDINLNGINTLVLMTYYLMYHGSSSAAYMYLGSAARACFSMGLHVARSSQFKEARSPGDAINRTWVTLYNVDCQISFSLGRVSAVGGHNFLRVEPSRSAFFHLHPAGMQFDFTKLRVELSRLMNKIQADLYQAPVSSDLNILLRVVADLNMTLDKIYEPYPQFRIQAPSLTLTGDLAPAAVKEWWWARLHYFHLRLVMYRPLMIVAAYLKSFKRIIISEEQNHHLYGALNRCAEAALDIPAFMMSMTDFYPYLQGMWYNGLYLEWSCFILIFYITAFHDKFSESHVLHISDMLDRVNLCLETTVGPIANSDKLLAADCIRILRMYFPHLFETSDDDLGAPSEKTSAMNTYLANLADGVYRHETSTNQQSLSEVTDSSAAKSDEDGLDATTTTPEGSNDVDDQHEIFEIGDSFVYDDFQTFWETSIKWMGS